MVNQTTSSITTLGSPMPHVQDIIACLASHPDLNEQFDLMEHHLARLELLIAELRQSLFG